MAPHYPQEIRDAAKRLYIRGYTIPDIERETGVPNRTLYKWQKAEDWDHFCPPDTVEIALSRRLNLLAESGLKTPEEQALYERLLKAFGGLKIDLAKAELILAQANALNSGRPLTVGIPGEADYQPAPERSEKPKRRREKSPKNDISGITPEMLDEARNSKLFKHDDKWYGAFGYQQLWYEMRYDPATRRVRIILKSRQIGATAYFAFEALDNAIRTGDNQLFISASRDQAGVFKSYIIAYAKNLFDVELKGQDCITLSNGAELRFLSTNSNTAQSYHGHLYIDEIFWIANYKKLKKVSSGMAAHKKWTTTLFSTPSALSHEAYAEFSGELYNKGRPDDKKIEFDISHNNLKNGWLGPDKKWRHMVTVEDAEAQGCDLFDIDDLRLEYSEDDFNNLFMCRFIDDSQSVFSLSKLLACTVDIDDWPDYHAEAARPFGNKPVALGYDPSRTRDNASLALLAVPLTAADPWRALRTMSYHGQNFQYQSNRIKDVKESHYTVHIGIDTTGIGRGVFELVQDWFPLATPIHYSIDEKTRLVVKALDVIENGRFKYLAGNHEITRAFLMITKTTTGSGLITYASNRNTESGHADIAWSIMHGLSYEPINNRRGTATATFSH